MRPMTRFSTRPCKPRSSVGRRAKASWRVPLGAPRRKAYGLTEPEKLDIHRAARPNAPIFAFIHGGAWLGGEAKNYAYAAEMFVNTGAHFVALDFVAIEPAGGDLW
jgi:arylformamidase